MSDKNLIDLEFKKVFLEDSFYFTSFNIYDPIIKVRKTRYKWALKRTVYIPFNYKGIKVEYYQSYISKK